MPEVPHPREHHRNAPLVRRVDHRLIVHRAARLDKRGCTCIDRGQHTIGEREERIRRNH